eukprot:g33465.t1
MFMDHYGLHDVKLSGEAGSADQEAANNFVPMFLKLVEQKGYRNKQVFNVEKTSLFYKEMGSCTCIIRQVTEAPGFKDHAVLLLAVNNNGDFKHFIHIAWEKVTQPTINDCKEEVWSDRVANFEGFLSVYDVVKIILHLAKEIKGEGFEDISEDKVEDILNETAEEQTNKELDKMDNNGLDDGNNDTDNDIDYLPKLFTSTLHKQQHRAGQAQQRWQHNGIPIRSELLEETSTLPLKTVKSHSIRSNT